MARPTFDNVRIAARTLAKQPGFTVVVVLSLALAIAINTTMYSVLDALISPRIDVRQPENVFIIQLYGDYKFRVSREQREQMMREGLSNVEGAAWVDAVLGSYVRQTIEAGTNYTEGSVKTAGPDYLSLIGPKVLAGRLLSESDRFVTPPPIVIGEKIATRLFPDGANPIGGAVRIGDSTYSVIGVVSRYADFPDWRSDVWRLGEPRAVGAFTRVIRLKPGASGADADRELTLIATRIALAAGEDPKYVAFRFFRPAEAQFHASRMHIAIGMAVISVLLVACANLANMQLARGITRRRELALRSALGASRGQIVRHLLTESVLLATGGLLLGIVLTLWGASVLRASIPPAVGSYIVEPQLSWRVFVFALVATMACIVLVGLLPAIRVSRVDPNEMLKSGAGTGATRKHRRQYGYLVAAEIGLALSLMSAATVMVRSALAISIDNVRFDPRPLVGGYMSTPTLGQGKVPMSALLQSAVTRVTQIEGVTAASASLGRMVDGTGVTVSDSARGVRQIPAPGWGYSVVAPTHLRTFGIPIVRGRDFRDGERDESVVIIDENTAEGLWPGGNPIGAMIKLGDDKSNAPFVRIVGVAGRIDRRRRPGVSPEMRMGTVYYLPGPRDSVTVKASSLPVSFTARAPKNTSAVVLRLRHAGGKFVSGYGEESLRARQGRDFIAYMFSLFAALGLGLAAFGVYGVVAHSVAERRRELGVRIALGALARDILHAVLRESVAIALAGIAVGLIFTKYGVMLLAGAGDDIYNAPLFAGVALFMLVVTAASAMIPAMRATKVDPTESLRCE